VEADRLAMRLAPFHPWSALAENRLNDALLRGAAC
jgi:hypothetical protein